MSFRFITKSIHAYLIDYPIALVLMVAPFVLKLGQSGPVALWLSVVTGVAALLLAAFTDHQTGLVRIIPYWLHLWVDRAVGLVMLKPQPLKEIHVNNRRAGGNDAVDHHASSAGISRGISMA